eukprot:TRINITY_DN35760_c0_g1_i1.p1 TRINITY_DN35760_c0_g1~~TRINITY_DN35760_c0_g1_i1.p1  ORF type:complete len:456 (+),score=137.50 TRINITY_DN35760_c0_g1_i1:62-1429(+)
MFLHLFVAEKAAQRCQFLCDARSEPGASRASHVASECLMCLEPAALARLRGAARGKSALSPPPPVHRLNDLSPFAASLTRRSPSPGLRGRQHTDPLALTSPPLHPDRGRSGFDSSGMSDGLPQPRRRRRSSSLRWGERPGDVTNVRAVSRGRTSLFDVEMPHRCGLKAFVVVDCALIFACVTRKQVTRDDALPLLRSMRREFLQCVRPDRFSILSPADCDGFAGALSALLRDANGRQHRQLAAAVPPPKAAPVLLNVYNILDAGTNGGLGLLGLGLHHTGIEVHGKEWSYGGTLPGMDQGDETGVFSIAPRTGMPPSHFKESLVLGTTRKSADEVDYIVGTLIARGEWRASDYHILQRNCNTFCSHLAEELGGWTLPGWVNRAAKLSAAVVPDAVLQRVLSHMQPPPQPQLTSGPSEARCGTRDRCAAATVPIRPRPTRLRRKQWADAQSPRLLH